MVNKTILIISPEAWGANFVSKHHYANYLAKDNTVYFLNPVENSIINPLGNVNLKVEHIKENLVQLNYQNLLPRLNDFPKFIQSQIYKKQAQQIQDSLGIKQFDIVWNFDPNRFWNQENWITDKTIYHAVDDHKSSFEQNCSLNSTITIIVSEYLRSKFEHPNLHFIGHGADVNAESTKIKIELPQGNSIKLGLIGNFLSSNIDFKKLIEIAIYFKDTIDLVLIGPFKMKGNLGGIENNDIRSNINTLEKMKNVHFLGSKPSSQINSYIETFDMNLILYKDFKKNIYPHKLMQYLLSGKLTITSYIYGIQESEIIPFISQKNNNNIIQIIEKAITQIDYWNKIEFVKKRKEFAIFNSYENKINKINNLLYD